jgi:hypothetical protein
MLQLSRRVKTQPIGRQGIELADEAGFRHVQMSEESLSISFLQALRPAR